MNVFACMFLLDKPQRIGEKKKGSIYTQWVVDPYSLILKITYYCVCGWHFKNNLVHDYANSYGTTWVVFSLSAITYPMTIT